MFRLFSSVECPLFSFTNPGLWWANTGDQIHVRFPSPITWVSVPEFPREPKTSSGTSTSNRALSMVESTFPDEQKKANSS